jgi:hypothetical protein|tara:strand:+ start:23995 stop:24444 length:450 start_codon:yes stop_codon:yes gene_type:complete
MALSLKRLIFNLANIKHEHTNQNKFLKTKAKIKEMRSNIKEATKDAKAIHDYVEKAEVSFGSGGGPPILEKKSFVFMADYVARLQQTPNLIERDNLVKQMKNDLELGLSTSSAGRYLTTRGRSRELRGKFRELSGDLLKALLNPKGRLK